MKNKYPIGTIFLRETNDDYGIVIGIKTWHKNRTTIYSVSWSKRIPEGVVYDYTEEELSKWYIKV